MKWLVWIAGSILLIVALIALGLVLGRKPLLATTLERIADGQGLIAPEVSVRTFSLTTLAIDVAAGPDGQRDEATARLTYDLATLRQDRALDEVVIDGARLTVRIDETGAIRLPSFPREGGQERAGEPIDLETLPFSSLSISDSELTILTPEGEGLVTIAGEWRVGEGGAARMNARAESIGLRGIVANTLSAQGEVTIDGQGAARVEADLAGGVETPVGATDRAMLRASGTYDDISRLLAGDWMAGEGQFSADLKVLEARPAADRFGSVRDRAKSIGVPINTLSLDGAISGSLTSGLLEARIDVPIAIAGEDGFAVTLSEMGVLPFLRYADDRYEAAGVIEIASSPVTGRIEARAEQQTGEPMRTVATLVIDRAAYEGMTAEGIEASITGTQALDDRVDVEIALRRLDSFSAPMDGIAVSGNEVTGRVRLVVDPALGTTQVLAAEESCLSLSRARLRSTAASATLRGTTLCPTQNEPWFEQHEDGALNLAGSLQVDSAAAQVAESTVNASRIRTGLRYRAPADSAATAEARWDQGESVIPDQLRVSRPDLSVTAQQTPTDEWTTRLAINGLTLAQVKPAPDIAPLHVSGDGQLAPGGQSTFALKAQLDRSGRVIGTLRGRHHLATGKGSAQFESDGLNFAPGLLQPMAILPALRGLIANASGGLDLSAAAEWSDEGVTSRGQANVRNLSFSGPGVAVAETRGLSGTVALSSLLPPATDGRQTLNVDLIDLRAFPLEDGEVSFTLPGNDSLIIHRAAFPWFGGTLYTEDAEIGFDADAVATLRADDVNLDALLAQAGIEGLTGEGRVRAELPLVIEDFALRIENGLFQSLEPGVIRYTGQAATAAAQSNAQARLAFDVLEDLRYDSFEGRVDGRLDGTLNFDLDFDGSSAVKFDQAPSDNEIETPVKLRIKLEAPLLELVDQARVSRDFGLQLQQLRALEDEQGAP